MTLEEFLLARIAEDEASAEDEFTLYFWTDSGPVWTDFSTNPSYPPNLRVIGTDDSQKPQRHRLKFSVNADPARVLAECEAKRRIVELHQSYEAGGQRELFCTTCGGEGLGNVVAWPCETLRALALPYADQEKWT